MKPIKLANIPEPDKQSFAEKSKQVKKKITKTSATIAGKKATYSLHPDDVDYINKMALSLGQKQGKNVSASEALRTIINDHKAKK